MWATPNECERGPNEGAQPSRHKQEQAERGGANKGGRGRGEHDRWAKGGRAVAEAGAAAGAAATTTMAAPPFLSLSEYEQLQQQQQQQINILL